MRKRRSRVAALATLGLGFGWACGDATKPSDAQTGGPSFAVTAAPVGRGPVQELLETFGTVELDPEHTQTLTAGRAGELDAVYVVPGQIVKRGDALLELGPVPSDSLEAERAKIDLEFAQRDLERLRRMAELKLATNQEVQAAEKQLEASRVGLASLGLDGKGATSLQAPNDGVVAAILVAEGALVQSGQELLRLAPVGSVAVRVGFEVEEISRLSEGLPVLLEPVFQGIHDDVVPARLSRLHRIADPATQLVEGLIHVAAAPPWAVAGTRVRVRVVLQSASEALRVPRDALVSGDEATSVFVVEQGTAHLRRIEVGATGDGWVEVRSGLSAGQLVVVAGRSSLTDGVSVRVAP